MYIVPDEKPTKCNKCPFGHCVYSLPMCGCFSGMEISTIDGKKNEPFTKGYVCNLEFKENQRYTKCNRTHVDEDVEAPDWCQLLDFIYFEGEIDG